MISVIEHLYHATSRYFDRDAIVHDGTRLTYLGFAHNVKRAADTLIGRGITPGDSVALLDENTPSLLVWFYAIMGIGARAVLLNRRLTASELADACTTTECKALVYGQNYLEQSDEIMACLSAEQGREPLQMQAFPGTVDISSEPRSSTTVPDLLTMHELSPEDDAFVLFTGGSTGTPKAAVFTHEALANWIDSKLCCDWNVLPSDVVLLTAPAYHMSGIDVAFSALSAGATIVLASSSFDPAEQLDLIEQESITKITIVPLTAISALESANSVRPHNLSSIRGAVLEGSTASDLHIDQAFRLFPNSDVLYSYGMTENALAANIRHTREEWAAHPERHLSVGRLALYSQVKLVDRDGNVVPDGIPGIALGKSPCMFRGYLNADSEFDDEGWFDTGDVLRRDENGYYYYVGRTKMMIKTGGENVFAAEVEAIIREHPCVLNCVVFGMPDSKWSEAVTAAIQLVAGRRASEQQIIDFCKTRMAHFKRPQRVYFIDELPLNLAGKVDLKRTKTLLGLDN